MKVTTVILKVFISLILSSTINTASAISTYHIGNSLTWDALNGHAMKDIFEKGGVSLVNNYHIRCGSSLNGILSNTDDACVQSADGPWNEALANNSYDFLILQPHEGPSTEAEISAMQSFASMTDAQIVIYEAYPDLSAAADLSNYYLFPDQNIFRQTQAEFSQIRNAFPNSTIIPAMEVLIELDLLARQGDIPGMNTAQDFYRDSRHLNEFGRYALGLTHFSALTGLDPSLTGLELHDNYNGVTDQEVLIAQKVVRQVVLGTSPVPLPATVWLFGTSLLALLGLNKGKSRRKVVS